MPCSYCSARAILDLGVRAGIWRFDAVRTGQKFPADGNLYATMHDGARKLHLTSPEYGGDGKQLAPSGLYSTPVLTFHSTRAAPLDLLFYTGTSFPASYRRGAFIVLHGTGNVTGYNVVFVPFDRKGKAGEPTVFADGFAAFDTSGAKRGPAKYRPTGAPVGPDGAPVGPDGALYISDSQKGRIWRIAWGNN